MPRTEVLIECRSCRATGVYRGFAERDGAAVVCRICKGDGAESIAFTPFTGRRTADGVETVFAVGTGYVLGRDARGGVRYADWLANPAAAQAGGAEARDSTCPAGWYNKVDPSRQPQWSECDRMFGRTFEECPGFKTRDQCWTRWDMEHPAAPDPSRAVR